MSDYVHIHPDLGGVIHVPLGMDKKSVRHVLVEARDAIDKYMPKYRLFDCPPAVCNLSRISDEDMRSLGWVAVKSSNAASLEDTVSAGDAVYVVQNYCILPK